MGAIPLDAPGYYYAPTLVADAEQGSEIVAGRGVRAGARRAARSTGEDEAVRLANDTPYGLAVVRVVVGRVAGAAGVCTGSTSG